MTRKDARYQEGCSALGRMLKTRKDRKDAQHEEGCSRPGRIGRMLTTRKDAEDQDGQEGCSVPGRMLLAAPGFPRPGAGSSIPG